MSAPPTIDRRPARPDACPVDVAGPMSPAVDRARVLGCAIDRLGMAEMVDRIDRVIAARDFAQHAAVNAAKLVAMRGTASSSASSARPSSSPPTGSRSSGRRAS